MSVSQVHYDEKVLRFARGAIVAVAIFAAVIPIAWTIRVALRPVQEYLVDPSRITGGLTLDNFRAAWRNGGLDTGFLNSSLIVPVGAFGATFVATCGGFALAKLPIPRKRLVLGVIIASIAIPLPAIVIPLFAEALTLGLINSRLGLGIVYAAVTGAWGTIFMRSYFLSLPDELLEAGRVDGCSASQLFLRIAVPLAAPAIATVFIINLFVQWSELLLGLVLLPDSGRHTLTVKIALFSTQFQTGGPLTAAAALIACLPIIAVFAVGQRFLRGNVFAGGMKG